MINPPTESITSIIIGFIAPTATRKLAILGNDIDATVLKIEMFASAACWQGYKTLEGLVPVLRTNQTVLARAIIMKLTSLRLFFVFPSLW
ncbi:MAG: hypothetical protein MUP60_03750, partial [Candidatus Thorarchaeota archaeon]|nr:hypothetical protein [Candidatus Thorarchaeota archaeon]